MRDSSVLGRTWSASAAPSGPDTRPRVAASARSIRWRSSAGPPCGRGMDSEPRLGSSKSERPRTLPRGEDHRALDDVLQLADVAGPVIRAERGHGRLTDPAERLPDLARGLARAVLGEERDVLGPLPQRRHPDREHVEPEEEVGAEPPLAHRFLQVPVRGRYHAGVRPQRLAAAHPLELALLQHAQQGDLDRRRQLAHLVEEDRAPGRQLEAAPPPLERARERPLLVAEQLRSDEPLRQRGAVDLHEGAPGPRRPRVDCTGDELLARSRSRP